jgi:hypothetical protein
MLRYKCEQIHNKNVVKLFLDVSDFMAKKPDMGAGLGE